MKRNRKAFFKKMILSLVTVCITVTCALTLGLSRVSAVSGNAITSGSFASTEGKWNGAKTSNLITAPSLPKLNTGDGKDIAKWQSNWNSVMVPAGWGSNYISGSDTALQVFSVKALDGSTSFAIRPAKSGTFGGGDACLGGESGKLADETVFRGGVSYTVKLSAADQALANAGNLRTSAKAEFYRQEIYSYYMAVSIEFYEADGTLLDKKSKTWSELGYEDGYLSRGISAQDVPENTVYIRYWFCNAGRGNARKAVKNMQAYLFNDGLHAESHDGIDFLAWNSGTSLPASGNYFLTQDVTISSSWSPSGDVNLCLNGYKIIQSESVCTVKLSKDKTLSVYDCTEAGMITHAEGAVGAGVETSGTFNLYGGKISGNGGTSYGERGGGVFVHSGTFNMYGGEISDNKTGDARGAGVSVGNTATDSANAAFNMYGGEIFGNAVGKARGSAVSVGGATTGGDYLFIFSMMGGKIYGNTSHIETLAENEGDADAVAVDKNGRFIMSGGEIVGNRNGVYVAAGVTTLSGTAKIYGNGSAIDTEKGGTSGFNLRLGIDSTGEDRYITVGSGGFSEGAKIGISIIAEHGEQISSGTLYPNNPDNSSEASLNYIYSEDSTKKLYYDSASSAIKIAYGHAHANTPFTEWESVSGSVSGGNYYLDGDIGATGDISIPEGEVVLLCLNGHTLNMGEYSIIVENGGSYSVCDCQASGFQNVGEIVGDGDVIQNNGSLSLDGGNISSSGGSAIANNNGASFKMDRGEVKSSAGSGILNNGGSVEASEDAAVSGSEGEETPPHEHEFEDNLCYCGAHSHDNGVTPLTEWTAVGGTVSENGIYYLAQDITATSSITIDNEAEITLCLNGHTLDLGTYTMTVRGSLTICDCHGTLAEQGTVTSATTSYMLIVDNKLTVTGGTLISTNSDYSTVWGSEINSEINISGGKVIGNNSGIEAKGSLTVSGSADIQGQEYKGISVYGTAVIDGGTVFGESAGIEIYGGDLTVNGGNISSNRYGIYNFTQGSKSTVKGGSVHGEESGIFIQNGTVSVSGGKITGDHAISGGTYTGISVTVSGGEIIGESYGIYSPKDLTFTGGTVKGETGIFHNIGSSLVMSGDALVESTGTTSNDYAIRCSTYAEISGGTVKNPNGYAVFVGGSSANATVLHICGNPVIEGSETKKADIYFYNSYALISPQSPSGDAKYEGGSLTLSTNTSISAADYAILTDVDADTRVKFSLINSPNTVLFDGTGESAGTVFVHRHTWSEEWTSDAAAHWHTCTADSCPVSDFSSVTDSGCKYTPHYAPNDDGNCTTDIVCATCNYIFTKGNADHAYDNACDKTCNNANCRAGDRSTSHVPENDDGDCRTAVKCKICQAVAKAGASDHIYTYSANGAVITEACSVTGCTVHNETATIAAPAGTLTYNGNSHNASVSYSANWKAGELTVSYTENGGTASDTKAAGNYIASITKGSKTASVSFTVEKQKVTVPNVASKVYTGEKQTADISETALYSIAQNNGGTVAGDYTVKLSLKDYGNYCWDGYNSASVDFIFKITTAENSFTLAPDIADWTFGEAASEPVGTAKFGTVEFSYYNSLKAPISKPTAAGTYYMKASVQSDAYNSYESISTDYIEFKIEKASKSKPENVGGLNTSFIDTADGKITGVTTAMEYKLSTAADYTAVSGTEITELASGTYYVRYAETDNYKASDYVTVVISKGEKRTADITNISDVGKTYNNVTVSNPTYNYMGDGAVTIKWYADSNGTKGAALSGAPKNAGTYWVGVSAAEGDTHKAADEVARQFVISKATQAKPSGVAGVNTSFTDTADGKITGVTTAMEYKLSTAADYTAVSGTKITDLAAGTYYVRYKETDNYKASAYTEITVSKGDKRMPELDFTGSLDVIYSGSAVSVDSSDYYYDGDGEITVKYYADNNGTIGSALSGAPSNAGTYWVGIIASETDTYKESNEAQLKFIIGKADYNMSGISFVDAQFTYDGNAHSLVIDGTLPTGADGIQVTVVYSGSAVNVSDGEVTVTATFATESTNYNAPAAMTAKVKINAKDIAGAEITLGTALTYTGSEQTQTVTSVKIDGLTVTFDVSGNTAKNVGASDYELSVMGTGNFTGTLKKAWNIAKAQAVITVDTSDIIKTYGDVWELPIASSDFGTPVANYTVAQMANADSYTLTFTVAETGNYYGTAESISVTVKKQKVAKPSEDNTVFTYNGSAQSYTVAASELYTVSGTEKTDAGNYKVKLVLNDSANYEWADGTVADIEYDFNIKKADYDMSGISFENGSFTYDGEAHSLVIGGTLPKGSDGITVTVSYDGLATNVADGEVTVTATFATESTNYNVPAAMTAKVEINPKDISGAEITLGTALTYNGSEQTQSVNSFTLDGLTVTFEVSGNTATNAGEYELTVTAEGNFTGTVKKTWSIAKASFDMSGTVFADATLKQNGEAQSIFISGSLPTGVSVTYEGNGKTDAGVYTVTAVFTHENANYNQIAPMTAVLTVNRAEIVDHIGENGATPNVIVSNGGGFAPSVEVVITPVASESIELGNSVAEHEAVAGIYDITLKSDGVVIQPDGDITIRILIPEELLLKEFRLVHKHGEEFTELEYTKDGSYAVFTVSELSEFIFVYDNTANLNWLIALLGAVALLAVGGGVILFSVWRKRKSA